MSVIVALAAGVDAERLPIRTYTSLDGLAHMRVECVLSDSYGFVWFCGPDGLSRFDGQGFTTYDLRDGLGSARVTEFLQAADGTYWVATNGAGVYRFAPRNSGPLAASGSPTQETPGVSRFQKIPLADSPQADRVNELYQDRAGRMWAGTDGGLFCFEPNSDPPRFHRVDLGIPNRPDQSVQVWSIAEDRAGNNLWIGTSAGLSGRVGGRAVHTAVAPTQGTDHVHALFVDRDDRVWLGHAAGILIFSASGNRGALDEVVRASGVVDHSRRVTVPRAGDALWITPAVGITGGVVGGFLQSADGDVWIATFEGLTHFDGKRFRAFGQAHGVGRARALAEDRDGNIWIGTINGAQRFARQGFRTYTQADGLADSVVRSVFENASGQLRAISHNQRIHGFDGAAFTAVRPNLWRDSVEMVSAGRVLEDRHGEWWVPGAAGVYRFPRVKRLEDLARVRPRLYTSADGLAGEDVTRLFEDSRGDIWIGRRAPTSLILTRWERATDTFHRYGEADGLPPFSRAVSFTEDRAGNVWIGFQNGGVARWRHGRFTHFTSSHGAPAEWVAALHVDRLGRLWIGALKPALTRVEDPAADRPHFVPFVNLHRLSGNSVGCITEDQQGYLYLCTVRGPIDRVDPRNGEVRRFTASDGVSSVDVEDAYCDRRGDVWFASYNGVLRLTPSADRLARAPAVRIAGVRVAGESYLTSDLGVPEVGPFELSWNRNRLQIAFFALGALPGAGLRYQYQLHGSDPDWNAPTDRRDVDYGSLSPGHYRFAVRAVGADGAVSTEPATMEFTILGPVWQRWWFQISVVAAMGLLAIAAHRLRVRQLLALQQVRMRIAADLHDDIGGSLSRIAIQSEVARREASPHAAQPDRRLSDIAESARDVIDSLSDVVWSVDPRRDDLASVFQRLREHGDDVIRGSGARWSYSAAGKLAQTRLTPQARRNLFLLLKEALTNISRHASATSVSMRVELTSDALRVEVCDDGLGFDPVALERTAGPAHRGIGSMRERAEGLRARLDIESARGRGTTLLFVMPRPNRWRRMTMLLPRRLPRGTMPPGDSGR